MKARNVGNYIIATAVILCSGLLLSTVVFAITGFRLSQPGRSLQVDFQDVTGIQPGTRVLYAGQQAGKVVEIRSLTAEERAESSDPSFVMRARLEINPEIPVLPDDIRCGIATASFLGDKFVALHPGSLTGNPLPDGAVIQATETGLLERVQRLTANLDGIVEKLNSDYDKLVPKVSGLVDRADTMVGDGNKLLLNLNGAVTHVYDLASQVKSDYSSGYAPRLNLILDQIQAIGTNVSTAVVGVNTNANETFTQVRELLSENREDLAKMIAELRVVSQNLKIVSTYAKALTGQLGEKPSRLIWSRKKTNLPSEQEILDSPDPIEIPLEEKKKEE